MKRLIFAFLALLAALPALAADNYIYPSQIAHNWGFIRKAPCGTGVGDNCGSNPPTWHITPDQCGTVFSTSTARNADGSTSTEGIRYTLPTVAEFTAAGMGSANGNPGNLGTANREAQCFLSFVMALPLPSSYVRIGYDGVQGTDKITFEYEGTFHDLHQGDVAIPAIGSAPITIAWNGVSWLLYAAPPSIQTYLGYGPMAGPGQGRLFVVIADPAWWTVGSKIGSLAYCPLDGIGTSTGSNGGIALAMIPPNCSFIDSASGSILYWINLRHFGSFTATGIAAGAAYGAGTALNGTAYAAGNYVVLTGASVSNLVSGDTVNVHNMKGTLGSKINGKWIAKVLTSPTTGCATGSCVELHEEVRDYSDMNTPAGWMGPPSSFVPGDTLDASLTPPINAGSYEALVATSAAAGTIRKMNPANGMEEDSTTTHKAIVGLVKTVTGAFVDSSTNRGVASWFNSRERKCQSTTAADRTTASAVFVEANADIRCTFVYLSHVSSGAAAIGDQGRRVKYTPQITLSNDTAGGGCQAAMAFDGTTAETEIVQMVNSAGGADVNVPRTLTLSGTKAGLSELTNAHYGTLVVRTNGVGTCKVWKDYTFNTLFVWQ